MCGCNWLWCCYTFLVPALIFLLSVFGALCQGLCELFSKPWPFLFLSFFCFYLSLLISSKKYIFVYYHILSAFPLFMFLIYIYIHIYFNSFLLSLSLSLSLFFFPPFISTFSKTSLFALFFITFFLSTYINWFGLGGGHKVKIQTYTLL